MEQNVFIFFPQCFHFFNKRVVWSCKPSAFSSHERFEFLLLLKSVDMLSLSILALLPPRNNRLTLAGSDCSGHPQSQYWCRTCFGHLKSRALVCWINSKAMHAEPILTSCDHLHFPGPELEDLRWFGGDFRTYRQLFIQVNQLWGIAGWGRQFRDRREPGHKSHTWHKWRWHMTQTQKVQEARPSGCGLFAPTLSCSS